MTALSIPTMLMLDRLRGTEPCVSVPPALEAIWRRAQAANIPLSALYVTRQPLSPLSTGGYMRDTAEVWIAHADDVAMQRALLYLCGMAQVARIPPLTVEEDVQQMTAAYELAAQLGRTWGLDIVDDAWLAAQRAHVDRLGMLYADAVLLAGINDPASVRGLVTAVAMAHPSWSWQQLEEAIGGYAEDEALNDAVLDADRGGMRSSWSLLATGDVARAQHIGPCVRPQSPRSARVLREALRRAARITPPLGHPIGALHTVIFLKITSSAELGEALAASIAALTAHPHCSAQATWTIYGDDAEGTDPSQARVYRLSVRYRPEDDRDATPLAAEVWVAVIPYREDVRLAEAALQRFLLAHRRVTRICSESLAAHYASCFQSLAAALEPRRVEW